MTVNDGRGVQGSYVVGTDRRRGMRSCTMTEQGRDSLGTNYQSATGHYAYVQRGDKVSAIKP